MVSPFDLNADVLRIFEATPRHFLVLQPSSPSYTVLAATNSFLELTGTDRATILGRGLFGIGLHSSAATHALISESLSEVVERKQRVALLVPSTIRAGGQSTTLTVRVINHPVLSSTGEVIYIIHEVEAMLHPELDNAIHDDLRREIEERKRAEKALSETARGLSTERARLALALKASRMGVFEVDFRTDKVWWSPEIYEVFGMHPGEFSPSIKAFESLVYPDDLEELRRVFEESVAQQSDFRHEFRIIHGDGSLRWIANRTKTFFDSSGQPIQQFGVALDISETKQIEESLVRAREEAESANHAKDQFLAKLSHEIRTPLTPALLAADLLQKSPDLTPQLRSYVDTIKRNITLEARLIEDLLDHTRLVHDKLRLVHRIVNIHEVIEDAVDVCKALFVSKDLELQVSFGASHPYLEGDGDRLQQVLWNLLANAAKFTPHGGKVSIESRNAPDGSIEVLVRDTGLGIDCDSLESIFEPFQQRKCGEFGGLGLGLGISKRFIELHGGEITAASDGPGTGSTFCIKLRPASSYTDAGKLGRQRKETQPAHATPQKILLVEDHGDTATLLKEFLELSGHTVTHRTTVKAALSAATGAKFDLLLCDLGLPDGSGIELITKLGGDKPANAVAITGYGQLDDIRRCLDSGFNHHLTKPVDLDDVGRLIAELTTERALSLSSVDT